MSASGFLQVQPIIGTRDVERAVQFYVERLGFALKFKAGTAPAYDLGFLRDNVELHMQFQYPHEMGILRLRILVGNVDALYDEYKHKSVFRDDTLVANKPWGTRELAIHDPDGNALTFYRHLERL